MKGSFFKSCFIFFSGMLVALVVLIGAIILGVVLLSRNMAGVKNNSWLLINFPGEITEMSVTKMPSLISRGPQKIELYNMLNSIEAASFDNKIKGILINGDLISYSLAHNYEIKRAISEFKKSGKKVIAWYSEGNNYNYDLCLIADEIYMPDTSNSGLTLTGYVQAVPYLKNGLDKLGIEFNVVHIGDYKLAGENYSKESMSDEYIKSMRLLFDNIYNHKLEEIVKNRGVTKQALERMMNDGSLIFMKPDECEESGFIDGKKSYRELCDDFSIDNKISIYSYSQIVRKKIASDTIAVIYAEGTITNYYSGPANFVGNMAGAKTIVSDIEKIKKNEDIKAVVLRVNSPGGSALGSELVVQALQDLKKVKPVYASMGPIAASGGYYVSSRCDKIFAAPNTITGSIGVVSIFMNRDKLHEKLGINYETLKKNEFDDFLSPLRTPSNDEINILKESMLDIYDEFTAHVIEGRGIKKEVIPDIAQGRVWTGEQAKSHKLIDDYKSLLEVISYAADESNLKSYNVMSFPQPPTFVELLMSDQGVKFDLKSVLGESSPEIEKLLELYDFYLTNGSKASTITPFIQAP